MSSLNPINLLFLKDKLARVLPDWRPVGQYVKFGRPVACGPLRPLENPFWMSSDGIHE